MTGEELKQWREKMGLTQSQLTQLLGYKTYHIIWRYEKNKVKIPELVEFFAKNYKQNNAKK